MNRKIVHLSIFVWVMGLMTSTNVLAQGQADNWFDQGNQLYKNQQYKEAIMRWEAVLESGAHSGALY